MAEIRPDALATSSAIRVLGQKLDSIPFSRFHALIIAVLGFVGFVEGYDLAMTGSLLVLAKNPLHLTPSDIRFLTIASTLMLCVGGFAASTISDHWSRKRIMQIGVVGTTLFTLMVPFVQNGGQLIALRLLTGLSGGFAVSAPFPIAAELMPAQHRRTYGAVYEMSLASAFTVLPLVSLLMAGHPGAFRFMALPGGLMLFVAPVLIHFVIPESPRWHLRRGRVEIAVASANRLIHHCGDRVSPLSTAMLKTTSATSRVGEELPPFWALFGPGQLRWTIIGVLSGVCAGTAAMLINLLLPKALVDQGAAVSMSFGLATIVYVASIPGKAFTGFLMEIIGRRWTITYALAGSLPGLLLMLMAHRAGVNATIFMAAGGLITGFTVLSAFTATRVYLSEQFPTALRGRGQPFGESFGRIFAGVVAPFLMVSHTASPTIFFGTIAVVVAIGAFIPPLFGKETVGQLEIIAAEAVEPA
jgi:MFS transporter, putative metabolite:H+ symporter